MTVASLVPKDGGFWDRTWERRFFETMRREAAALRYTWPAVDPRRKLAAEVEHSVRLILRDRGHRTGKTGNNAHWDLWCNGARLEVKAARWDGRRYQANLRGNEADILVFGCLDAGGALTFFIIPWAELGDRRTIEINSRDPAEYSGQWAAWLGAWDVIDDLAANPPPNPWQLSLFDLAGSLAAG